MDFTQLSGSLRCDNGQRSLHAGMWLFLGEVASKAQVRDPNMTVFIQQDISWLMVRVSEREKESQ